MTNLLPNPSFDTPWDGSHDCIVYPLDASGDRASAPHHTSHPEIHRPTGWQVYYIHQPDKWHQPEGTTIHRHVALERIRDGNHAYRLFCSFKPFWAGLFARVQVRPAQLYRLTAHAHAWTNHNLPDDHINCDGDPFCSAGAGRGAFTKCFDDLPLLNGEPWNDALRAARFTIGIDPYGGTDPFSDAIRWSAPWAIYNEYHPISLSVPSRSHVITVFLQAKFMWGFRNNDAYWDDVSLTLDIPPHPSPTDWVSPAFPYEKTAVLMTQDATPDLRAAVGAALAHPQLRSTGTQSVDDAASGPLNTTVKAVGWATEHRALEIHFATYYPHATLSFIDGASPTELAVHLLPPLAEDIALSQRDPRWADHYFGEDPGSNLGAYGCFVTAAAIALRHIYGTDVKPDILDQLMVNARHAFVAGNLLDWDGFCGLFHGLQNPIKHNNRLSAAQLQELLKTHVVILRRADGAHFVYLERVEGTTLHIIDPWDGKRKTWSPADYRGIRAARAEAALSPLPPSPPDPPTPPPDPPSPGPRLLFGAQEQRYGIGRDEFIARVKPPAWMLIQAYEDARRIKELSPDTLVVIRHVDNDWHSYLYADDVDAAARRFIDHFRDSLERNAEWIDYVQDLNEYIACNDYKALRASGPWLEAFCAELDRMGYPARPVGFNAGVGNPQHNWICDAQGIERQIPLMVRGARALHYAGGAFGYHGYHGSRADGFCTLTTNDGEGRPNRIHFSMRSLLSQDPVFVEHGLHIDHILTECGAIYYDHTYGMPNAEAGWKWPGTMGAEAADRYIDEILLLNSYFRQWNAANDNRLLAAIIFLYGGYHGWRYFDLEGDFAARLAHALEADREAS